MRLIAAITVLLALASLVSAAETSYLVCVRNEKSGTVTLLDGRDDKILGTIPIGKRPRGIHANAQGRRLFVALTGSPNVGPRLGVVAIGDDDLAAGHPQDDGIGIIDLASRKSLGKMPGGPDPEQFAVSADGSTLYIANEDTASLSI